MLHRNLMREFDYILFGLAMLIFLIGLSLLYSAAHVLNSHLVWKQMFWMVGGLIVLVAIINISYRRFLDFAYPLYGVTIVLLILVLYLGDLKLGAKRWFDFGFMSFQPSELAKIATILTLARWLGSDQHRPLSTRREWRELLVPFLFVAAPLFFIVEEPDLGTALCLFPILFSMLYIWGASVRHLLSIMGIGLLCSPFFWWILKDYQRERLFVFLNPNLDPLGAGYTMIQSKIAIGSGGWFGKGLAGGTQSQLNFLPESYTDFIFSVAGEELGFFGTLSVILLYLLLIRRCLRIAHQTKDQFGKLIVTGVVAMLSFHVLVNTGMTMGFMPIVGLPLPLMSYGGTSLLVTVASIALVLNVKMYSRYFKY